MNTLIIARRKGGKVRYFDTERATMGKWVPAPVAPLGIVSPITGRRVLHNRDSLRSYTVADLKFVADSMFGIKFPSRYRKSDMVEGYLSEQKARLS